MAFKYSRYKPIYLNNPPTFTVTEWPICADSVLYRYAASNVPQSTEVTLWEGKTAGYTGDSGLRDLADDVMNKPANTQEITNINFNPFTYAGHDLNSKARFITYHGVKFLTPYSDSGNDESDNVAELVTRAFNCKLQPYIYNVNYGFLYSKTPGEQYVVGYNYLDSGANARASNSMFGSYTPHQNNTLWSHAIWRRDDTVGGVNRKILECSIRLFPEEIFAGETKSKDGCTLDPDGSISPVPDGTASQRLDVRLNIHIYFDELSGKWNWNAGLYATEFSNDAWDSIMQYQDKRTGTVHNPNDPGDDDDDPGGEPVPDAPTTDIVSLGAANAYIISPSDLHLLFDYLNSVDLVDSLVRMWSNPIQGIVSLHILPFQCEITGSSQCYFHGLPIGLPAANPSTFLSGSVPKTWQTWNMGSVYVPKETNTYTDMSPFTKVSIYIPFVGMHHLDADEVVGKNVQLNYTIDVITGSTVAFVSVNGCVRYTYTGNCAYSVPVSQANWGEVYMSAARIVAAGVQTGITAAMETGSAMKGLGKGLGEIGGSVGNIAKPNVSRSGSIGCTSAIMASRRPYILLDRPVKAYNKNGMKEVEGLPSTSYVSMGALSGYQEIKECHLDGIGATDSEKKEIESLLKSGVFF